MSVDSLLSGVSPVGDLADGETPVRIVIVGAGPAAAMLLERITASHRRDYASLHLEILLVDPHEPGGGRIWRKHQSPLLKLNSMLEDVAFFTDESCVIDGPIAPGPSLSQWVKLVRGGEIPMPQCIDETLQHELSSIGDRDFPTRRLNNVYLEWAYREVLNRKAATATITWRQGSVVAVNPEHQSAAKSGTADETDHWRTETHVVVLESGEEIAADIVVYAVGHNGSAPSNESIKFAAFANRNGLDYVAPAFTADVDFGWVKPKQEVIVRGMGLAAVDLTILLTEGRGGCFERDHTGRLSYRPSGREPRLFLGSRRGVPYRSKVTSTIAGEPVQLEYLTEDFRASLASRTEPLDFERDIWPLLCAEMLTGYYRELFIGYPDRVTSDWASFSKKLAALLATPFGYRSTELDRLIRAHVANADDRFVLASFDRPLDFADETRDTSTNPPQAGRSGNEAVQQRVLAHIEQDLRQRTNQPHSATQALFLTTLFAFMSVAEIEVERWNAVSRVKSLPKRWQTFFSYLASGPPGHRLEELIALAEAGIVHFLGGDIEVELDELHGRFLATGSARTSGGTAHSAVTAEALIDAWLPEAQAEFSDNPLLRQLIRSEQMTELKIGDADFEGSTGQIVVGEGGKLGASNRQFALGPFTSAPGAGAFTRPAINSLSFRVHDRVARAVLEEASRGSVRSLQSAAAGGSGAARGAGLSSFGE